MSPILRCLRRGAPALVRRSPPEEEEEGQEDLFEKELDRLVKDRQVDKWSTRLIPQHTVNDLKNLGRRKDHDAWDVIPSYTPRPYSHEPLHSLHCR